MICGCHDEFVKSQYNGFFYDGSHREHPAWFCGHESRIGAVLSVWKTASQSRKSPSPKTCTTPARFRLLVTLWKAPPVLCLLSSQNNSQVILVVCSGVFWVACLPYLRIILCDSNTPVGIHQSRTRIHYRSIHNCFFTPKLFTKK